MDAEFHYPPDVFDLLIETISRLSRGKKGVVLFLQGAGVAHDDLAEVNEIVRTNPKSITKFEIVRKVLTKVNARGDSGLRPRREIIKRVTEFESFDTCWPEDRLEAKGLVASVREAVNAKDSFTRMKRERDVEREQVLSRQRREQVAAALKRANIEDVSRRLFALFSMDKEPQERGRLLEAVLNDLFKVYGILVREDFRRREPDSGVVLEQIDGVIELDGTIHLVEMKWLNSPVGMGEFSPHLSRLFMRANAHGIFIATNGYTQPVITECANALSLKTMFLCSLQEFVLLLQRQGDLVEFLKEKSRAAIVDKKPYLEILG
ncbi:restriction endonuclease [Rhodanobacter sp. L36]|uniref:restriction endonuclease n=1 Tax=Rhodanobacter sp. L36 TaxID=1747221 RepID=UPI00131B9D1C|nr:restriction endonuclease [Rhodanobacter sp. L36]